jgi:hypothetical protein
MNISPLLSSPRNTPVQSQRQGINYEKCSVFKAELDMMLVRLKVGGATKDQFLAIQSTLKQLQGLSNEWYTNHNLRNSGRSTPPQLSIPYQTTTETALQLDLGALYTSDISPHYISQVLTSFVKSEEAAYKASQGSNLLMPRFLHQEYLETDEPIILHTRVEHTKPPQALVALNVLYRIARTPFGK